MYGVIATIHVKPGFTEQFIAASVEDARGSVNNEPGCLRFDVLQDRDDPNCIYLIEGYVDEAAFRSHVQQPHCVQWRETVKDWYAAPTEISWVSGVYPPGK